MPLHFHPGNRGKLQPSRLWDQTEAESSRQGKVEASSAIKILLCHSATGMVPLTKSRPPA